MKDTTDKNIIYAVLFFILSTAITWWFIVQGNWLYPSKAIMHLSNAIAGAVWAIQIIAAFVFLGEKKWEFLRRIGFICLVGSCVLLPYCFGIIQPYAGIFDGFIYSLALAVAVMLLMYFVAVRKTEVSLKWFFGWILCLATAITLQLTVVFKVI